MPGHRWALEGEIPWAGPTVRSCDAVKRTRGCRSPSWGERGTVPHALTRSAPSADAAARMRTLPDGPVAQRLVQGTHNPLVVGSNPTRPINPDPARALRPRRSYPRISALQGARASVRALFYNRSILPPQRRTMMQAWPDRLETLKED